MTCLIKVLHISQRQSKHSNSCHKEKLRYVRGKSIESNQIESNIERQSFMFMFMFMFTFSFPFLF